MLRLTNLTEYKGTTAGYKDSFAYDKLREVFIQSVVTPDEAIVMGGDWRIPVKEGLFAKDYIKNLKVQDTFKEEAFNREYGSIWGGDAENAFFSSEKVNRQRQIKHAEREYTKTGARTVEENYDYIIGVDVGRLSCTTEACVFKVEHKSVESGKWNKTLVDIYSYEAEHFGMQALHLKKLFYQYRARTIAIDANGLGVGLIDFMVIETEDPYTGDVYPPFGVENDPDGIYKSFKTKDTELNAIYLIKANLPLNTAAYTYTKSQLESGRVKLLIDDNTAKTRLLSNEKGRNMSINKRNAYLKPYVQTTILVEQMLNLVEQNEGQNIILKRTSRRIGKDKFSAFIYGLYYIKLWEDSKRRRAFRNVEDMMFFG